MFVKITAVRPSPHSAVITDDKINKIVDRRRLSPPSPSHCRRRRSNVVSVFLYDDGRCGDRTVAAAAAGRQNFFILQLHYNTYLYIRIA